MFCALGALVSLVGLSCLGYYFKQKSWVKDLLSNGVLVDGAISRVYASSLTVNNVRQWKAEYTYKDLRGGQHTGKTGYLSPEAASEWKTGSKIKVRYDQHKPYKSIWQGA